VAILYLRADQLTIHDFGLTSHTKNLHLGGAQEFQIELIDGVVVQPKN
jgi:hypothetical protein